MQIFLFWLRSLVKRHRPIEVYTDGSSKQGVGSWAYVIPQGRKSVIEKYGRVRRANSNTMEFQAAIEALSHFPADSKVVLYSDSKILVNAMKLGKVPRGHQPQIDQLNHLKEKLHIEWVWVKAHHGHVYNERCDELCSRAREIGD